MKDRILSLINEDTIDIHTLKNLLSGMNALDISEIFSDLDREQMVHIFRILPKVTAAEVFAHIDNDQQQMIVEVLTDMEIGEIMDKLFVDDAVDFIEEMPANVIKRVLRNVKPEKRALINHLLQYPEDSAGSLMTTEYVDLHENATVRKAFGYIRRTGVSKETIYTCYVIRRDHLLVGVVSAKTLMLARPWDRIGDIMDKSFVFAYTTDDQEVIADKFRKYGLLAMPVVDKEHRLVGIITIDDIVEVIVEEATEDIEKMGALAPSDEPYLKTSAFKLAKNRFVWLLALMLSATITAGIIASFEDSLAVLPVLISFIPMLMGTAGNAGAQSSTLIIRGMAVGEIRLKDILRVMWRELRVGSICGLALGSINLVRIYFMNNRNFTLSLTVTLSLFFIILMSKTIGSCLPIIAKKMKIDPTVMAAPLITTIVDAGALLVYFAIAKIILGL
jgi:magnesium transporter